MQDSSIDTWQRKSAPSSCTGVPDRWAASWKLAAAAAGAASAAAASGVVSSEKRMFRNIVGSVVTLDRKDCRATPGFGSATHAHPRKSGFWIRVAQKTCPLYGFRVCSADDAEYHLQPQCLCLLCQSLHYSYRSQRYTESVCTARHI